VALAITDIFDSKRAALAPLAGITDSVFRRICVEFGARPVMTEMISADGFVREKKAGKTTRMLSFHDSERPIGFQFFGSDPLIMAEAVHKAQALKPDFIDINAGCPVKKVVSRGSGSALLRNPELLGRIVEKAVRMSTVPVTVKIRSGWDSSSINAVEVARTCADAGAQALTVHPRTRSQEFSGTADWSIIRRVKEAVTEPVIGSGDIRTPDDAVDMLRQTGADAVMIGRLAMSDPWIFTRVMECLNGREVPENPFASERLELGLRQLDTITEEMGERYGVLSMRKFFGWYSHGTRDGAAFRQNVFHIETIEGVKHIVREFQEHLREYEMIDSLQRNI